MANTNKKKNRLSVNMAALSEIDVSDVAARMAAINDIFLLLKRIWLILYMYMQLRLLRIICNDRIGQEVIPNSLKAIASKKL